MNCPNCGAVINGSKCEYCGTIFNNSKELNVKINMIGDGEAMFRAVQQMARTYRTADGVLHREIVRW